MTSVAQIIRDSESEIVEAWLAEARRTASARGLSSAALENMMPLYLSALADQVETGRVDANDQRHQRVQNHLSRRLRQGFALAEMLEEFVALGRCIARVWRARPEADWPPAADIERLHFQLHVAMTEVTNTFHRHMLEDEQTEKRYLGQLQKIASEALHDLDIPLRDRLRDVLDVVMDAMEAQCAAFLLYDVATGKLVLVAGAGVQALEPYATSLDPASFVGRVALHEEPTRILDATSTALDVPDSLRESGIHSLLGIRLPPHNKLFGVMYIGIAERREFATREIRRYEALAERLALHLENAQLFEQLHDKIAALDVEKALRERFVSMLAHDLRGPLSTARLAAEMLSREPASLDRRRDLALKIDRNIDRVDRMIRDLLDANRIRAGEPLPLRLDTCDLIALVEQIAEEARTTYGDRFRVETGSPVRGIWSDEDLHRAIWNLVVNAVKYGDPDQPITIAVTRDGDSVRVAVHNEGVPIPAAELEHIFDAYARATTANGPTGWGLGLTLVRGTAEAHGGRVSVTSDAAAGTTFTIELPLDARTARAWDPLESTCRHASLSIL